ncbi:MAG: EF-P lysine aminoacylase EpmA [Porticoccus sp.]|jgi:lysyl-tRNA synthetase class 2|uniref:EF-P lysine aminoacylase EpmA n=1 Tax=Porticoccus sp. Uisw_050_02 TaxID=3230978 RepID=UPI00309A9D00
MSNWRPTATIETLKFRSELFFVIRNFFKDRKVLEVDVPLIGQTGVTDLHVDCIEIDMAGERKYLQSSPEYFMKRLLASGSGSIYSLGKAFRAEEIGRYHQPEFTLLEWYRLGFDEHQLMSEFATLIKNLGLDCKHQILKYADIFEQVIGLNPHKATLVELQKIASIASNRDFFGDNRSDCLNLIFSFSVEPNLPDSLIFIHDYPECQSALARLKEDSQGNVVARRFEVYLNRVELANGYVELNDPDEQRGRFAADASLRETAGKKIMPADDNLLDAVEFGLPFCSGVAMGVDRLLMQLLGMDQISQVMPFACISDDISHE